jgi:hypothetical protein
MRTVIGLNQPKVNEETLRLAVMLAYTKEATALYFDLLIFGAISSRDVLA